MIKKIKDGMLESLRIQAELKLANWKNTYYVHENNGLYNVFVTLGSDSGCSIAIHNINKESLDSYINLDEHAIVKHC